MNSTEKQLRESLGLTEYEAKIYLALLEGGSLLVSDIAKKTDIPRTAVYPPLQSLLERGMVSEVKVGKRTHYSAIDPKELIRVHEQKRSALEETISSLTEHIGSEAGSYYSQYFKGIGGIDTAMHQFLDKSGPTWYTIEDAMRTVETIGEARFEAYIDKLVKKGITAYSILPSSNTKSSWVRAQIEKGKDEKRFMLVVSQEEYPISVSMATDGEHLVIFSLRDTPFATLIKSRFVAGTFVSMHRMIWDRYDPEK